MLEIKENTLDTDTYLMLRHKVGWIELSREQAKKAIDNALYTLCASYAYPAL